MDAKKRKILEDAGIIYPYLDDKDRSLLMDSLIDILEQIERTLLDLEYDICVLAISFVVTVTVVFIYHIMKEEKNE